MFQALGDLPGGDFASYAEGVSPNGEVVVGTSSSAYGSLGNEAFIWSASEGMVGLGEHRSIALASSYNGSVVVGGSTFGASFESQAFRWSQIDGVVGLGDLPGGGFDSVATGVSTDGSRVVGAGESSSGTEAFVWSSDSAVMVGLGDLPGGQFQSTASDVSADGSVIVGAGWSSSGTEAFIWTSDQGMLGIGDLPGGDFKSYATAVSADGTVIVGTSATIDPSDPSSTSLDRPFRWTQDDGMVGLGVLGLGLSEEGEALDVSADGSVIVGSSGGRAFVWDPMNGMRELQAVLTGLGLNINGWVLSRATGISDDGLTIVGTGINPAGHSEAFIARLPEPATITLLTLATLTAASRRKH